MTSLHLQDRILNRVIHTITQFSACRPKKSTPNIIKKAASVISFNDVAAASDIIKKAALLISPQMISVITQPVLQFTINITLKYNKTTGEYDIGITIDNRQITPDPEPFNNMLLPKINDIQTNADVLFNIIFNDNCYYTENDSKCTNINKKTMSKFRKELLEGYKKFIKKERTNESIQPPEVIPKLLDENNKDSPYDLFNPDVDHELTLMYNSTQTQNEICNIRLYHSQKGQITNPKVRPTDKKVLLPPLNISSIKKPDNISSIKNPNILTSNTSRKQDKQPTVSPRGIQSARAPPTPTTHSSSTSNKSRTAVLKTNKHNNSSKQQSPLPKVPHNVKFPPKPPPRNNDSIQDNTKQTK